MNALPVMYVPWSVGWPTRSVTCFMPMPTFSSPNLEPGASLPVISPSVSLMPLTLVP